ncbi:head-tail connector protein [Chitinibacteraceae bacterium HSL-7]
MKILLTPPASEPVSLATAKQYLRVEHAEDDALIGLLISAARQAAEHLTGRVFAQSSWYIAEPCFPSGSLPLGLALCPVRELTSVQYRDQAGVLQTLDGCTLWPDEFAPAVLPPPSGWPATLTALNAVQVQLVAGFEQVPPAVVQWILLRVGTAYENREALVDDRLQPLPRDFTAGLLDPFRVVTV